MIIKINKLFPNIKYSILYFVFKKSNIFIYIIYFKEGNFNQKFICSLGNFGIFGAKKKTYLGINKLLKKINEIFFSDKIIICIKGIHQLRNYIINNFILKNLNIKIIAIVDLSSISFNGTRKKRQKRR